MTEQALTKNELISILTKSPHGKLGEYLAPVRQAAGTDPGFVAHLIAWNHVKGTVRDAKQALPISSLASPAFNDAELVDNSLAHLAMLAPRELVRAYRFALEVRPTGHIRQLRRLVAAYLVKHESRDKRTWERVAIVHHAALKELYALAHVKPSGRAQQILFDEDYAHARLFQEVRGLAKLSPIEAAGVIIERKLPFLIVRGALGAKAKDPDLLLALIKRMSPTELVTNAKYLERMGVNREGKLRAAFAEALERARSSKKAPLKAGRAAQVLAASRAATKMSEQLDALQEKQLDSLAVQGRWFVLGDMSGSMENAMDAAKEVAALLVRLAKSKPLWLVFFNTSPSAIEVSDATLDTIRKTTRHFRANGGTSIGCALQRMFDESIECDGIAIVSDGAENTAPFFWDVYDKYAKKFDKEPPVYLYRTRGESGSYNDLAAQASRRGRDLQVFDLTGGVDYYSLPNLVATMRTNRYSLIDEIMATKLRKVSEVLKSTGEEVIEYAESV